ncbi:hypothetical protein [Thalassospira mesophila]|uniref:Uncharacterized protein n=1 Tax=Thalassospira mesophila TaxID=1293891 RepID=A0A1Y2L4J6_9PROT|nr:hypothetical protein [Thalassospira mesophila]OSQ40747.1 hypothetical protein TMES_03380 [Thalassospira mesophila]
MSDLTNLISAAISAFSALDAHYQAANITQKTTLAASRNQAANAVIKLRDRQVAQDITINPADITKINALTAKVQNGAALQAGLTEFLDIVKNYVPV